MSYSKNYINIYVKILEEFYELLGSFLTDFPVVGIEERLDEVIICIEADKFNDDLLQELRKTIKTVSPEAEIIKTETLQERNWNEEWEQSVEPIIIDDGLAITPSWHADKITQPTKIIINPKMSFGTGHHATTRLVCRLMKDVVKQGSFWIDAGTGTGVLAIYAVMLGADSVFAFDNNEWAVENSTENIELNNCEDKITIETADIFNMKLPRSDGIAANMYTHILTRTFPKFYDSLKHSRGDLLVSGVLVYDKDELIEAATKAGFKHIKTLSEDEWIAVHFIAEKD